MFKPIGIMLILISTTTYTAMQPYTWGGTHLTPIGHPPMRLVTLTDGGAMAHPGTIYTIVEGVCQRVSPILEQHMTTVAYGGGSALCFIASACCAYQATQQFTAYIAPKKDSRKNYHWWQAWHRTAFALLFAMGGTYLLWQLKSPIIPNATRAI